MTRIARVLDAVPAPVARLFRTGSLPARAARPIVNRLLPDKETPVTVRSGLAGGLSLVIEPRREKYYWTGTYETPVQEQLALLLRRGSVFWDVGAHAGFFTLLASRLVGDEGEVHAFEPAEANRLRLSRALELNGVGNVTVHAKALACESGEAELHSHGSSSMWSLAGGGTGLRVEAVSLDDAVQEVRPPDVLKLDVEGVEVDVLRGGRSFLEQARPPAIVEFTSAEHVEQARALVPFYRFRRLGAHQWLLS